MTAADSLPAHVALQLARRVARAHEELLADPAPVRSHAATLNDTIEVWAPGNRGRLPDEGSHVLHVPVGPERHRLCVLAGTLPGRAAAQVLLIRPNETVVAFSRRAGREEIVRAAEVLRAAIPTWSGGGDGSAFPREGAAARGDYWQPRPSWQVTMSGIVAVPAEPPPLVDLSTAIVLSLPGAPEVGEVVARQWAAFLGEYAGAYGSSTAFAVRVAEIWAWAAVDGFLDTLGLAAARRDEAADPAWGGSRESVLGRVRGRLTDPRAVLPDDPRRSLWKRLGIRGVRADEQDTLVLEPKRGGPLRVELVPVWHSPGGTGPGAAQAGGAKSNAEGLRGTPARALHSAERTVLEVDVTAHPDEIEVAVWSGVASGLGRPRDARACSTSDLALSMEPAALRATSARLAGLAERFDRAVPDHPR